MADQTQSPTPPFSNLINLSDPSKWFNQPGVQAYYKSIGWTTDSNGQLQPPAGTATGTPQNPGTPQGTSTGSGAPTTPQYVSPLPTYSATTPNNALGLTNPTAYSMQQGNNQVNPFLNTAIGGAGTQQNQYTSPLGFYSPSGGTGFYQQ